MTPAMFAAACGYVTEIDKADRRMSVCKWKIKTKGTRSRSSYERGLHGKIRVRSCSLMKAFHGYMEERIGSVCGHGSGYFNGICTLYNNTSYSFGCYRISVARDGGYGPGSQVILR